MHSARATMSRPSLDRLLDVAAQTLRQTVVPALEGSAGYQARIIATVLALAGRELRQGAVVDSEEIGRLQRLLDSDETDRVELNRQLAEKLRTNMMEPDLAELVEHFLQTAIARAAIDQPDYSRYRQLTQLSEPNL